MVVLFGSMRRGARLVAAPVVDPSRLHISMLRTGFNDQSGYVTTARSLAETGRLRLTDLRYQNGAASQLDWLDAQRSLFTSQQAMVQVRLAYLQNQVALYKTLGGGAAQP